MVTSDKTAVGIAAHTGRGVVTLIYEPDNWPIDEHLSYAVRHQLGQSLLAAAKAIQEINDPRTEMSGAFAMSVSAHTQPPLTHL
jgi:hypothetical protein